MKTSHRAFSLMSIAASSGLACSASTHHDPSAHHAHHGPGHHRFDDAEKWAKMFDAPDRDAWQRPDEVVALIEPVAGQSIADIGAGTGYFLARLSRAVGEGGRVLGIDVEPSMVEHMRARAQREGLANVEARLAELADPKLDAGTVHRILIVDTWHHIEDRGAYAAKLHAALVSGGAVYVVDFTPEAERGPPKEMRLSVETVIAELSAGGLTAEVVSETLPDQFVVRGRKP